MIRPGLTPTTSSSMPSSVGDPPGRVPFEPEELLSFRLRRRPRQVASLPNHQDRAVGLTATARSPQGGSPFGAALRLSPGVHPLGHPISPDTHTGPWGWLFDSAGASP